MSHFTRTAVSIKADRISALKKAFVKMGIAESKIETGTDLKLKDYYGHWADQNASLRIKGRGWGSENAQTRAATDIGVVFQANGDATIHMDEGVYPRDFVKDLMKQYTQEVLKETATETGFYLESEMKEEDGTVCLVFNTPY